MNSIHLVPVEGRVPYAAGLEWQRELARAKIDGDLAEDLVLLLEHEPVVTLGRGARDSNVVASPELLESAGVSTVEVERGGDVTYHGPGQLVGYPILDLNRWKRDLHWYLRQLEQTLIDALSELGLASFRYPAFTGVWVGDESAARRLWPGDGPGAEDRFDRRAREPLGHVAWIRSQRDGRTASQLRSHRSVRHR